MRQSCAQDPLKSAAPRDATSGNENADLGAADGYGGWHDDEQWVPATRTTLPLASG